MHFVMALRKLSTRAENADQFVALRGGPVLACPSQAPPEELGDRRRTIATQHPSVLATTHVKAVEIVMVDIQATWRGVAAARERRGVMSIHS